MKQKRDRATRAINPHGRERDQHSEASAPTAITITAMTPRVFTRQNVRGAGSP
jgi:hypothetical protein